MLAKSKTLLWISIGLNLIFLVLGIILLVRRGGISYVINKIPLFEKPPEQSSDRNKRRQNTYFSPYYQMRLNIFQSLPNSQDEIIFLGDSLTDQGEWQEFFNNIKIKNRGINGDTTEGILYRIDEILASKPKKIFILIGTNDFWNERKSLAEVVNNYQKILETIQKRSPETQVYIQSLLPVNNLKYRINVNNNTLIKLNDRLKQVANEFSYQYIDLYSHFANEKNQLSPQYTSDGAHLNGEGYLRWKQLIEKYVN
jgi:lysophospholipase L1-like esterase